MQPCAAIIIGIYSFDHTPFTNFSHFNFNQKKYLEELQKAVLEKVNPEKILATVMSRINTICLHTDKLMEPI